MNKIEKAILINQFEIMESLGIINEKEKELKRNIVLFEYETLYYCIFEEEFESFDCKEQNFVFNILELFWIINGLIDNEKFSGFFNELGFDGNNEADLLHFARTVKLTGRGYDLKIVNSHAPMKHVYERMLDKYNKIKERKTSSEEGYNKLTIEEITEIYEARKY